ncbi:MAG: hypothetical protein HQK60_14930 [Deltaproteobacteria bacterium]|nr:hypothetical protein [Deltaproteobacteria bacterium]
MRLMLNGEELIVEGLNNDATLGDMIKVVETRFLPKGHVITIIKVHDDEISHEAEMDLMPESLAGIRSLEISSADPMMLAAEGIKDAQEYIKKLIGGVGEALSFFRTMSVQDGGRILVKIVEGLNWFTQIVSRSEPYLHIDYASYHYQGKTLAQHFGTLRQTIIQMSEAQARNDWVLLADLLEYELTPILQIWEGVLPVLEQRSAAHQVSRPS